MSNNKKSTITFHYCKTSNYRAYNIDGVFGGLTSKGKIYAEFFNEKQPTPSSVEHTINDDGSLGDEINRDTVKGIVRQIECGVMMDIDMAKALKNWLDDKINEYKNIRKELSEKNEHRI